MHLVGYVMRQRYLLGQMMAAGEILGTASIQAAVVQSPCTPAGTTLNICFFKLRTAAKGRQLQLPSDYFNIRFGRTAEAYKVH